MICRTTFVGLLIATSVATALHARDIHYGSVTDADLLRCDRLAWRGQKPASTACYRDLLAGNSTAEIKAEAAWALGELKLARPN